MTYEEKSHSATDGFSKVDETGHDGFGSRTVIDLYRLRALAHDIPETAMILTDATECEVARGDQHCRSR